MDLWIRTQDKKYFINVKRLKIEYEVFDEVYFLSANYTYEGGYILGEYKKKRRAFKVLK